MNEEINPDDDGFDLPEEYFKEKNKILEEEDEAYFPIEESKPPHYY